MRLLQYTGNGFNFTDDLIDDIPPYAILSHTWGSDEVTYQDLRNGVGEDKAGYNKIRFCEKEASRHSLQYFWIDTCCIDQTNSAEHAEAIVSMYRWYQKATICIAYLTDVASEDESDPAGWHEAFCKSRWFTRGWTLPELLAPESVEFFDKNGILLGDKSSLENYICDSANIPIKALHTSNLSKFGISERLRWMESRTTTVAEDKVYAMFGLFDVYLVPVYGEGEEKAMLRLEEEIENTVAPYSLEPFQDYTPLKDSYFRLLLLYPESDGFEVKADIKEFSFLHHPNYIALSYVWGLELAVDQIWLNEKRALIRPNLLHALQRMRNRLSIAYLWVDSICIDQSNEVERNIQVSRMADIYQKAESVWIWLGEEDSTSPMAMECIPQIVSPDFEWKDSWWDELSFLSLDHLLERPWFRRRWVVQEAALAENSVVFCGGSQVDMKSFSFAVQTIRTKLQGISASLDITTHLNNFLDSPATRLLDLIQGVFDKASGVDRRICKFSLETLVDLATFTEVTDQRDSIFALLSLASDAGPDSKDPLKADYGNCSLDVFTEFISRCCQSSGSLDIICRPWAPTSSSPRHALLHASQMGQSPPTEIPSWIASRDNLPFGSQPWSTNGRFNGRPLVGSSLNRVYNTHNGTKPQVRFGINQARNGYNGKLFAKGIMLGSISKVSQRMARAVIPISCLSILDAGYSHSKHWRKAKLPDIVWRVLCADRNGDDRNPAPLAFGKAMESLDFHGSATAIDVEELLETKLPDQVEQFLENVQDVVWNRRTFRGHSKLSRKGFVGLVPRRSQVGDHVCILYGCSVPVVLRKEKGMDGLFYWRLIGEAYVHGFMDGEGISSMSAWKLKFVEREFEIH